MLESAVFAAADAEILAPARELRTKLKELETAKADIEKTLGATSRNAGLLMEKVDVSEAAKNLQRPETLRDVARNTEELAKLLAEQRRVEDQIAETRKKLEERLVVEKEELEKNQARIRSKLSFDAGSVQDKAAVEAAMNEARGRAVRDMEIDGEISAGMSVTLLRDVNLSQTSGMTAEATQLQALHGQDEKIRMIGSISNTLSACFTEKGKKRIDMFVDGAKALGTISTMIMTTVAAVEDPASFALSIGTDGEKVNVKETLDGALERLNRTLASAKGEEIEGEEDEHSIDKLVECTKAWQETMQTFQKTFEAMEAESKRAYANKRILKEDARQQYEAFRAREDSVSAPEFMDERTDRERTKANELLDGRIEAGQRAKKILETDLDSAKKELEQKRKDAEAAKKAVEAAAAELKKREEGELHAEQELEGSQKQQAKSVAEAAAEKAAQLSQDKKEKEHKKQLEVMLEHKDDEIASVDYELDNDERTGKDVIKALTGVDPATVTKAEVEAALQRICVNGLPAATYFKNALGGITDPDIQASRIGDMIKDILHEAADPKSADKIPQTIAVENEHFLLAPVRLKSSRLEAARKALVDEVGLPGKMPEEPKKPKAYGKLFHAKESRAYDEAMKEYRKEADKHKEVKDKWDAFHKEHDAEEKAISGYNGKNRKAGDGYNDKRIEAAKKEKKLGKEGLEHAVMLQRGTRELPKDKPVKGGRTV